MIRSLSSFDIYVLIDELQEIVDDIVDKIYQLSRDEILIKVKNIKTKKKQNIYIRNGKFLTITNKNFSTPDRPSVFALTLRKYLMNGIISSIVQHEFDRVLKFNISKKEGEYTLVVELFSNGNIILVDPSKKIILPLIKQSWAHRKIKGREEYTPPPSQTNPFKLSKEKFAELIKNSSTDIVRTLAVSVNLSGIIAEEICNRANVDKKIAVKEINDKTINRVYKSLNNFLDIFKKKDFNPVFVKENNVIVDILPFEFKSFKSHNFEEINRFSKGLEFFIDKKEKVVKKEESKADENLGKLERQLTQQKDRILSLEEEIKRKKLEGDLIYLHYQDIEQILKDIKNVLNLKEKHIEIKKINEKKIVKKFVPDQKILIINLSDTKGQVFDVKINHRLSVADNAEKAYDENKKFKTKLSGAKKSLNKTLEEIQKVKEKKKIEDQKAVKKIVKKEKYYWFERFRWFISSEGNIIVGGRDAKTNDIVVKKYLKEGDRYSHADVQGAPSIVIKSKNFQGIQIPISENTLGEACIFAASFSKAWKQFAEAQAYWVLPEQVSKSPQSGEFVPHGAFIIRGKRNYLRCKLEVAVGKIVLENTEKVMCGPVSAVRKYSKNFVVLVPGNITKTEIANKLSKIFDVNVDEIDRVLPSGGSQVVDSIGVKI